MFSNLTLSQKGMTCLVGVLAIQVIFVVSLSTLQRKELLEIDEAIRIQNIISSMNRVSNLWSVVAADAFRLLVDRNALSAKSVSAYKAPLNDEFRKLKELVRNSDDLNDIKLVEVDTNDAIDMLERARGAWKSHNTNQFQRYMTELGVLADGGIERANKTIDRLIGRQERNYSEQSHYRFVMKASLATGLALNFILVVAIASLFTREIAHKFAVISDNTKRLAQGMVLNPVMEGNDEISKLDQEFHSMADALIAANIKERAAVDNALDLICTLDEQSAFLAVNPAAESVLGYKEKDLIGRPYLSLVAPGDRERARIVLNSLLSESEIPPFNHTVIRADGKLIDVQLSAHWSSADRSLFCVIYDVSQQRQMERMKQEFTHLITTDLRGPLLSVRSTFEELSNNVLDDDGASTTSAVAATVIKPVLRLISDLLEMEKIDAAMLSLDLADSDLQSVVIDALYEIEQKARDKNIVVRQNLAASPVKVDRLKIQQALTNLLTHAINVSSPGSEITISCAPHGRGQVSVEIGDAGAALSETESQTIFDPIAAFQSDHAGNQQANQLKVGNKVALSVAKLIVEAHRGTIRMTAGQFSGNICTLDIPQSSARS